MNAADDEKLINAGLICEINGAPRAFERLIPLFCPLLCLGRVETHARQIRPRAGWLQLRACSVQVLKRLAGIAAVAEQRAQRSLHKPDLSAGLVLFGF
jgi:hypothetical protein